MHVDVRYFAAAREAAGRETESVALDEGATVAVLRDRLLASHPGLRALDAGLRFAVEQRFATLDCPLLDGAQVALLPPVSGG